MGGLSSGTEQPLHSYRVAGLAVASEIELPGAIPAQPAGTPDVTVRAAPVPASLDDASNKGVTWQIAGERFLFQVPGVARFLLTAGREIAFEPEPASMPATFRFLSSAPSSASCCISAARSCCMPAPCT